MPPSSGSGKPSSGTPSSRKLAFTNTPCEQILHFSGQESSIFRRPCLHKTPPTVRLHPIPRKSIPSNACIAADFGLGGGGKGARCGRTGTDLRVWDGDSYRRIARTRMATKRLDTHMKKNRRCLNFNCCPCRHRTVCPGSCWASCRPFFWLIFPPCQARCFWGLRTYPARFRASDPGARPPHHPSGAGSGQTGGGGTRIH